MSTQEKTRLRKWLPWLGFVAVLLAAYFINVEVQTRLGEKVLANTGLSTLNLKEALAAAESAEKKVLVDMSAIWCPTCRRLDREIFSNERVKAALAENYIFSRIEYESEEGERFMEKYDVSGFPTLLILDAKGNKVKKLNLTFDPKNFIAQL